MMHELDFSTLTSDEAISNAERQLRASAERDEKKQYLTAMLVPLSFFGLLLRALFLHSTVHPWQYAVFCIFIPVVAFVWSQVCEDNAKRAREASWELEALSGSVGKCKEALTLCGSSSEAQAIREQVLASGRQLYAFDLNAMREAAARQERKASAAEHAAVCRELHGLTA